MEVVTLTNSSLSKGFSSFLEDMGSAFLNCGSQSSVLLGSPYANDTAKECSMAGAQSAMAVKANIESAPNRIAKRSHSQTTKLVDPQEQFISAPGSFAESSPFFQESQILPIPQAAGPLQTSSSIQAGMMALAADGQGMSNPGSPNNFLLAGLDLGFEKSFGKSFFGTELHHFGSLLGNEPDLMQLASAPPTYCPVPSKTMPRHHQESARHEDSNVPARKLQRLHSTARFEDLHTADAEDDGGMAVGDCDSELTYQQELDRILKSGHKLNKAEKAKLRREKNKHAARKCRQRKQDCFMETETKLKDMQAESDQLRAAASKTALLMRKHVALYAALETACLSSEPVAVALRGLLMDCCKDVQLNKQDMLLSCSLAGFSVTSNLLSPAPKDVSSPIPFSCARTLSVADPCNYIDAHGRSLAYVSACAIFSGQTVTTGHNPVPEKL